MPNPDFQVERVDDTISISGRLDFATATQALEAVSKHFSDKQVIDMSGITHSNSAGLAVMIEWLAIAKRGDQQLTFQNIPDSLHQISTVCQVDSLI